MNWEAIEQNLYMLILFIAIFVIAITIIICNLIWFFIKSAVREGVKEALKTTVIKTQICDIANGLVFDTKDTRFSNRHYTDSQEAEYENRGEF